MNALAQPTTFMSCLTPPGAGAIATLAVAGPDAWAITRAVFQPFGVFPLPESPQAGKFWLGRLGDEKSGADEVVLAAKHGLPDPLLELHCHGGIEVVRFLQEIYQAGGAHVVSWADFFGRSETSPLKRKALEVLVQTSTVRTAAIALDQYKGAFEKAVGEIVTALETGDRDTALIVLKKMAFHQHHGRHLIEPFRVALSGAPNVGKSSLVNALAGFTRSVVSSIPGTTRDVVTTRIVLGGWPVELIDTAGLRAGGDALEREGMARARAALDRADVRLWVLDGSTAPVFPPSEEGITEYVVNKADLPPAWEWHEVMGKLCLSCKTGAGLTDVCQWLTFVLNIEKGPPPGAAVPFTPELCDQAKAALQHARRGAWAEAANEVRNLASGGH